MIKEFITFCKACLDHLVGSGLADPSRIAVAGLSRGAFIAFLLAAQDERPAAVLGFSPLTRIASLDEPDSYADTASLPFASLDCIIEKLVHKTVRVYIGNIDTRVSTPACFSFIERLARAGHAHKHRSPPVEMIIYPSIGHKGHGTPKEIFISGADWLADIL